MLARCQMTRKGIAVTGKTPPDGTDLIPVSRETPGFPKRVNPLVRSYTQDALDRIGHELERPYHNGETPADYMECCRRRDEGGEEDVPAGVERTLSEERPEGKS